MLVLLTILLRLSLVRGQQCSSNSGMQWSNTLSFQYLTNIANGVYCARTQLMHQLHACVDTAQACCTLCLNLDGCKCWNYDGGNLACELNCECDTPVPNSCFTSGGRLLLAPAGD